MTITIPLFIVYAMLMIPILLILAGLIWVIFLLFGEIHQVGHWIGIAYSNMKYAGKYHPAERYLKEFTDRINFYYPSYDAKENLEYLRDRAAKIRKDFRWGS